jgi:hypothetical protein
VEEPDPFGGEPSDRAAAGGLQQALGGGAPEHSVVVDLVDDRLVLDRAAGSLEARREAAQDRGAPGGASSEPELGLERHELVAEGGEVPLPCSSGAARLEPVAIVPFPKVAQLGEEVAEGGERSLGILAGLPALPHGQHLTPGARVAGHEEELARVATTLAPLIDGCEILVRIELLQRLLTKKLQTRHPAHRACELRDLAGDLEHEDRLWLERVGGRAERESLCLKRGSDALEAGLEPLTLAVVAQAPEPLRDR